MDTIRPIWPKDISAFLQEGEAQHVAGDAGFTPGTIVTRDASGNLVRADVTATSPTHYEIVWTDGVTRADATVNHVVPANSNGSVKRYTTLVCPIIADVPASLFDDATEDTVILFASGSYGTLTTDTEDITGGGSAIAVGTAYASPVGANWVRVKFFDAKIVAV
jgi:hypothetical protein